MTAGFFDHLRGIRAAASVIEDIRPDHVKATIIWTLMQSSVHADEILTRGFQSHPVIMNEVMEFQLEHRVDASEISAIRLQVKEAADTSGKTSRAVSVLTDKMNEVKQEIGNVRTEIKKKQDK